MNLQIEVHQLTRRWVGKGGKRNRRQQRNRMLAFAEHAALSGANSMAQVGKRQVIRYWKDNRHLADRTLYEHHRAISILWALSGKSGLPPEPNTSKEDSSG